VSPALQCAGPSLIINTICLRAQVKRASAKKAKKSGKGKGPKTGGTKGRGGKR